MGSFRYTSDLHFQHPLVARLRGFTKLDHAHLTPEGLPGILGDTDAHDGLMIENFNKGTKDDDLTIIAGDFAVNWKGAGRILAQLRGRIILVEGNHDIMSSIHRDGWKHRAAWTGEGKFEAITAYMRRKTRHGEYLISHYPYDGDHTVTDRHTQYRLRDEGMWLLHGHTHLKNREPENMRTEWLSQGSEEHWRWRGRQIHVGVDAWDFKPVQERDVLDLTKSLDRGTGREQGEPHA